MLTASLVTLGCAAALVLGDATASPWFWFFASVPLYVAAVRRDPASLTTTSGTTLTVAAALASQDPSPPTEAVIAWLLQAATAIGFGAWGIVTDRRVARTLAAQAEAARQAERTRDHSERLATIGRLVAGIAHEINNPLAVIRANLTFLRSDPDGASRTPAEQVEILSDAEASAERIQRLIRDMRAFTRKESPDAACAVGEVVDSSIRLARAGAAAAVTLDVESDGTSPRVTIERTRLEQTLLSLYANAVEALAASVEERGKAERRGQIAAAPRIVVSFETAGREARIRVRDNGPGLSADVLSRVFEPFFTTKAPGKGPGLGLAIAHEILAQAGGRITAANAPEGGALFEISLPIVPEPATRGSSSDGDAPYRFIES